MKFLRTYKEELITIPVMLIALVYLKQILRWFFPESAQYDLPSELETVVFSFIRLILFTSLSWLAIRIVFPGIHKYLVDEFYGRFHTIECGDKRKIGLGVFFAFLFALILLSSCQPAIAGEVDTRRQLIENLEGQLHVREATGHNDGPEVEKYLKSVGLGKGYSWCAAFCSFNLKTLGIPNPNSAWSPSFALKKDIVWSPALVKANKVIMHPQPGDCFTLYYPSLKRVGHVGHITGTSGSYFTTVEGNTNDAGSREGDGVFAKKRHMDKVYAVTNYITPYYIHHEQSSNHTAPGNTVVVRVSVRKSAETNGTCYRTDGLRIHRKDSKASRYYYTVQVGQYKGLVAGLFAWSTGHSDRKSLRKGYHDTFSEQRSTTSGLSLRFHSGVSAASGFGDQDVRATLPFRQGSPGDRKREEVCSPVCESIGVDRLYAHSDHSSWYYLLHSQNIFLA